MKKSKLNQSILTVMVSAAVLAAAQTSSAGDVTGLTSFSAGTPAVAAQVNGNFTAVKTAVDNNHARIGVLETGPSITGNITLVPSTATAGNIMKGAIPFLHDFGSGSTFLGEYAGNFTMTGNNNTASGWSALRANTTGTDNTASGMNALRNNTTGNSNTASGVSALFANTVKWRLHRDVDLLVLDVTERAVDEPRPPLELVERDDGVGLQVLSAHEPPPQALVR